MRRFRTVVYLVLFALVASLLVVDSAATKPLASQVAPPQEVVRSEAAATPALQPAAGQFVPVPTATVVNDQALGAGVPATVTVVGANGVPAAAQVSAVAVQVTATGTAAAGWLQTYATGTTRPSDSTNTFVTGRSTVTYDVVPVSANGQIDLYSSVASKVSVRLRGYFTSAAATVAGATFVSLPPTTVVSNVALGSGGTHIQTLAGANGIPAAENVAAVAIDVVASAASVAGGIRTYPTGGAVPTDTSVDYPMTTNQGNYETVKLSAAGQVTFAASGATRLLVRLRGYYLLPTATAAGSSYVSVARTTVVNGLALTAGGSTNVTLAGANGVPAVASVAAVAANVNATQPAANGVVTGYPVGGTLPSDASVYYGKDITTSGYDTLRMSAAGQTTFNSTAATKVFVRLRGYYLKATAPLAPTAVTAVGGDRSATVEWTPPKDGGAAITGYTVTANPGAIKMTVGPETSATIGGLTNTTAYTFTVQAINAVGTGPASAPSKAVVPMGPEVLYAHDLVGRVRAAFTSEGTGVEYVYDAVGNITATKSLPANELKIVQTGNPAVTPGDEYEIYGTGFGTDLSKVSVTIGGVNAPIKSLRRNHVSVTVPAGAASGAATMTVNGTTIGAGSVAVLLAPQVTSIAPLVADRSATITVSGANFAPATSGNIVMLNGTRLEVLTASPTSLTVKAPNFGAAGKISVRTKGGTGTSAARTTVVPAPFLAADVPAPVHVTIGTPVTVNLATSNQIALLTTDGTPGKRFGYQVDENITGCYEAHIWAPDRGAVFAEETLCGTQFIELPRSAAAGTYLLELDPRDPTTGSFTVTAQEAADVSAAITLDGAAGSVTTTVPAAHATFTFHGTKGQPVFTSLGSGSLSTIVDSAVLWGPNGQQLRQVNTYYVGANGASLPTVTLPVTGTYTIDVNPTKFATGTYMAQVSTVPPPLTATTTIDGTPGRLDLAKPGMSGSVAFTGSQGQLVHIGLLSETVTNGKVTLRAPDGALLYLDQGWSTFLDATDRYTLPQTGEYLVLVEPDGLMKGTVDVAVTTVPPDAVYPTTVDAPAKAVGITAPGQLARLTFTATEGQRVVITCVRDAANDNSVTYSLLDPTGRSTTGSCAMFDQGILFDTRVLTAGTWTVVVDPKRSLLLSPTLQVLSVPADALVNSALGSNPVLSLSPGQNGTVTFPVAAGQRFFIGCTLATPAQENWIGFQLLRPDGTRASSPSCISLYQGMLVDTTTSATAGTWSLKIDPGTSATSGVTLRLIAVPADVVKPATVGGAGVSVATTAGQAGRITFTGAANQKIKATVTAENYPSSSGSVQLLNPAGTKLTSTVLAASASITYTLPAAGTYTVLVDPDFADAGSATVTVANTTLAPLPRPADRPNKPTAKPLVVAHDDDDEDPLPAPVYPRRRDAALTGKILRTDGKPLAGVTVRVADRAVKTRRDGSFVLTRLPQGTFLFVMDGRTASTRTTKYGYFDVQVNLRKGRNKLFYQPYLPILDTANEVSITSPTTKGTLIKTSKVKGLEVYLPKGVSVTDADGKPVTRVGITAIPVDRTPIPMPKGVQVPVYFTIQPAGGEIHGGEAKIYYPNYLNEKPGTELNFWSHEKYAEGWEIYGKGNVTADGSQVRPSYDTGIENFDGAMINVSGWLEAIGKGVLEALGSAGDPVDLGTGRFTYSQSDLTLGGFIPIEAQRAYNSGDGRARPFGMGTMGTYDTFLTSKKQWEELDLNLIDGTQVHYVRTSPGRGYTDAAFSATGTFGQFAGSTIAWNGNGWDLRLRDGTTLIYGSLAPLQSIRDRFGHTVKIRRIAKNSVGSQIGAIVSVTSSEGYWLTYDYNTAGQITAIHDNAGRTVSYTYETGLLKTVTDVNGGVTTYGWDASKRLTTITDAKNQLFLTNTYDTNNRVVQQKLADGGLYKFDYVLNGTKVAKTTVTDPSGAKRVAEYDSSGYLIKDTSAAGSTTERGYSVERDPASHLPVKTADTDGRSMVSTYNENQQATATKVTLGTSEQQETATYNGPEGAMDSTTDALGNTTRYTFDAAGNVATTVDAENRKTSFEWNSDGLLTKQTPDGAGSTTYEYLDGATSAVTDALGRRTSFSVDAAGRVQETVAADGGVSTVQYDAANQVRSTKDPLGIVTTYEYDKNGNLESLKDARGGTTSWDYDAMDRVHQATDQVGKVTTYTYNALGRPETMTDRRGLTTEYRYDDLQRQVFTGFGRTGQPGAYQYQSTVSSVYDERGRLKSITDSTPGAGAVSYTYDSKDRPATETSPQGTITREWDDADRLATLQVPGLPDTTYKYDKTDQLTEVARGTTKASYGYDSVGRLKTQTLPGGVVRTSEYDLSSSLTGLSFASGAQVLGDVTYHYDAAGRLDRTGGSWARSDLPPPVASAQFDAANRMTSLDGASRSYDAEGNLTSDGTSTYAWNARSQLTATTGAAGAAQIRYDALGRRIGTTIGDDTWNLRYDGSELLVEDGPGSSDATYLAGLGTDSSVARIDGLDGTGSASALLADRQGSVLARTNPDAATLAAEYTYDPYGKARSSLTDDPNPVRYTGRESGPGTPAGLQFQRSRWYEPGTGRFLSEDPAGFGASGPNLYSYVGGNPVDATDPSGAVAQLVVACVASGAVNTIAGALLGRKHTAGDYLRGFAKGCGEGLLMFGVGKFLSVGLRSVRPASKALDEIAEGLGTACRTGPRSFTGETLVLMADGTTRPISEIKIGDEVLAADPETGAQGPRRVTALFEHPDVVVDLDIAGQVITTTEDHPFWNATDHRYEEAQDLDKGDQLRSPDGHLPTVNGLRSGTARKATAYNLTVNDLHTFYVLAGDSPVLVHNSGPGCGVHDVRGLPRAASMITDGPGDCKACAEAIQKSLGGGELVRFAPSRFFGPYRGQDTMDWTHHWVVVKDGRVFDAFTPRAGETIAEYKAHWEFGDVINFGF